MKLVCDVCDERMEPKDALFQTLYPHGVSRQDLSASMKRGQADERRDPSTGAVRYERMILAYACLRHYPNYNNLDKKDLIALGRSMEYFGTKAVRCHHDCMESYEIPDGYVTETWIEAGNSLA
jgi:hypothetical protein